MSGLPWFKCYPRDFNDGMVGLTLEERGAYVTVLNVIYARGGPVPDDASYFRALLCCSAKSWVKIRAALIVKRKLFEVNFNGDPCLMNRRAADEIATREGISESRSEAGERGGRTTQAKNRENKDLAQANVEQPPTKPKAIQTQTSDIEEQDADASFVGLRADDVKTAFDEWNALAKRAGLPAARSLDKSRRAAIRARLADGRLERWREALAAVERSPHCRGENDRGWRADLDFVCQPKSWRRLLEGFYAPKSAVSPARSAPPSAIPVTPEIEARRQRHYRDTGEWKDGWGPKPAEPRGAAA